jgi:hypothetical protein
LPIGTLAGLGTLCWASLFEYFVHRVGYHAHSAWPAARLDHVLHHDVYYPPRAYFEWGPRYRHSHPWWVETIYVALHAGPLILLARHALAPAAVATAVLVAYALAVHYVHPAVHRRTGRWWERTRWFKRMIALHAIHHRDQEVNFNFVLPLGDLLFGTYAPPRRSARRALAIEAAGQ